MTAEVQPMAGRDYMAEMREFIEKNSPSGDVIASTHAEKLVRKLMQKDPDLLQGWLMVQAVPLLSESIKNKWSYERRTTSRRRFARALAEGDKEALQRATVFDTERFVVDEHNTWRLLGDMTGKDHKFVADSYEEKSNELKMRAAFHKALARRVGSKKTSEVLSVSQYVEMWHKMVGH